MKNQFYIYDYYTNKKVLELGFESYKIALRYWKVYTQNDIINTLIMIK